MSPATPQGSCATWTIASVNNNARSSEHQTFIDWMKAVGMLLILIGHVEGDPAVLFNAVASPVYTKQLGVAFFVFVAGWSLAQSQRPRGEEAWRRLFQILLFGVACAVLMSAIKWWTIGELNLSNFSPFVLGVNVFFNHFPANPTTWYIGMYLQLILLWWWFMPNRASLKLLLVAFVLECVIRAGWLALDRSFTAYMMPRNWISVFLLGSLLSELSDYRRGLELREEQ